MDKEKGMTRIVAFVFKYLARDPKANWGFAGELWQSCTLYIEHRHLGCNDALHKLGLVRKDEDGHYIYWNDYRNGFHDRVAEAPESART